MFILLCDSPMIFSHQLKKKIGNLEKPDTKRRDKTKFTHNPWMIKWNQTDDEKRDKHAESTTDRQYIIYGPDHSKLKINLFCKRSAASLVPNAFADTHIHSSYSSQNVWTERCSNCILSVNEWVKCCDCICCWVYLCDLWVQCYYGVV